ncbi:MAG TPA: response regulator [Symbiobacteriaceae bacterium]|nr:response regulator [Symbiobacteriaceae bacterium]
MEKDKAPLARVLVVDDEPQIRRFLRAALASQGYEITEAGGVQEAVVAAQSVRPNLVILDLGLPDGDGLTVVKSLRQWTQIPILILSVRGREADKIAALDAGADDYLTKPFGTGELMARLRAAMRRTARTEPDSRVECGGLVIDFERHLVTVGGEDVRLTTTEYGLLRALALQSGKVLTHKQLLQVVWGPGYENETHMLRVNISNLRRKLEPNPLQPQYLITEPGVGYRLRAMEPVKSP